MFDDNTAELILTADGSVKNIVFFEELINCAPTPANWKFTALKPMLGIENAKIEMDNYTFDSDSLSFYSIDHKNYPDEVDIVVIHNDYNEQDKSTIINGTFLFLDNYLGELNSVTTIDNMSVISKDKTDKELIPITKLKDYLIWREKEFVEKYSGVRYNTKNDEHSILETKLESGNKLIAVINTPLINWDRKASHPWVATMVIKYDGSKNNGMPNKRDYAALHEIEQSILEEIKDEDGYLNIGRQTANGEREIYFACKEFRKISKIYYKVQNEYARKFELNYEIYKDKYWRSFEKFKIN